MKHKSIKRWEKRCACFAADRIISQADIGVKMQEEIDDLRVELRRLRLRNTHLEKLLNKDAL